MKRIKQRVFEIISKSKHGDKASTAFDITIMVLILLSILTTVLYSFEDIRNNYPDILSLVDIVTVVVFTLEYLLRIWTADLLYPDARHPRLKYCFSFMAIIDLLAILPFYIPSIISADLRFLRMVRLFRLFRLLRLFKLGRYFNALQTIAKVIRNSKTQLIMSIVICFFVMLFSAIVMYEVEYPVQPEQFPNIVSSLWWALCTLTTVGYGDVYPITTVGKFFASIISLVGIGIIAVPTGIISAGFLQGVQGKEDNEDLAAKSDEDLLVLQGKVNKLLNERGYYTPVSSVQEKENDK